MERSGDLARMLTDLVGSWGTERMWPAFDNAISTEDGTLFIGTDPDEWWDDQSEMRRIMKSQSEELQGSQASIVQLDAWFEGTVGWAAAKVDFSFLDGSSASMRLTVTVAQQSGVWKIVQGHLSVGARNQDVVGRELTL